jgi:hypothetical protein
MTMQMDIESSLGEARELIQVKKYSQARSILESLGDNPTAKRWLAKLDDVELFGGSAVKKRGVDDSTMSRRMMDDAILLFTQQGWNVKVQMTEMVQLEKKRGPSGIAAFLIILLFSLLGMFFVMLGIATAKTELISIRHEGDGTLSLIGQKQNMRITRADQAMAFATSVKNGVSYGGALAMGIAAFVFWLVIL